MVQGSCEIAVEDHRLSMERIQLPDCIGKPMCYSVAVATTSSQCSLDSFLIDWKQDANMYIQLRFSQAAIIKPLYPRPNFFTGDIEKKDFLLGMLI